MPASAASCPFCNTYVLPRRDCTCPKCGSRIPGIEPPADWLKRCERDRRNVRATSILLFIIGGFIAFGGVLGAFLDPSFQLAERIPVFIMTKPPSMPFEKRPIALLKDSSLTGVLIDFPNTERTDRRVTSSAHILILPIRRRNHPILALQ